MNGTDANTGDARELMEFLADVRRDDHPGVDVVAIDMKAFDAHSEARTARDSLVVQLKRYAGNRDMRLFEVNNRLLVMVPRVTPGGSAPVGIVHDIRRKVMETVGGTAAALDVDPSRIAAVLHTRRDAKQLASAIKAAMDVPKEFAEPVAERSRLTRRVVDDLAHRIRKAGASRFLREFGREQAIAWIPRSDSDPEPVGAEIFVGMGHLRNQLLPGVELGGDRAAFRNLTRVLDMAVIAALRENAGALRGRNVLINLNVSSMAGEGFARLASRIAEGSRAELWAEITVPDMLADMERFLEARRKLEKRNVRVMADRLTPAHLEEAERAGIDLHGYKFAWTDDGSFMEHVGPCVRAAVRGDRPVVLSRVEDEVAVESARALGVRHFQGFHVDRALASQFTATGFAA